VATAKEQLRRSLRRVRDAISPADASAAAESAARHLVALAPVARARTVALYAPVRAELDSEPAGHQLAARGVRLAYPRVLDHGKRLAFHEVQIGSTGPVPLAPGIFGIPEPLPSAPLVPIEHIDLFVVPGLAFDHTGTRLGWGHGFYDRTLAEAPSAVRVGFCYACQIVDHVPREADDLPMHYLVTDGGAERAGDAEAGDRTPGLSRVIP
jgi:5-formyltetrahydrofolate cyclo-ligase